MFNPVVRINLTIDEIAYSENINNDIANKAIELLKEYRNYLLNNKYKDIYLYFDVSDIEIIETVLISL